MNDGRNHVVDLDSRRAEPDPEPEPARAREGRSPWPWVLAAALGACAVGWALAVQEGRELAGALAVREAELAEALGRVEAHEAHLAGARQRVRDLHEGLGDLSAYLLEGPARAGAPAAAPPPHATLEP